jgi:RNA polymerase sigma-70 factor, ECF subfamily
MNMTLSRRQELATQDDSYPAEFEALFHQHWERLCRVLFSILGDWAEAEDLALETFMQLYRRPPAEAENLGGWLYRVATHLGLNALRSRKRRQHYEEQAGSQALETSAPEDPLEALERAQECQRVRTVLERLKPRSAQILILRHSGLPYTEIAAALDIAPSSVGTLLARAEQEFEKIYRASQKA